MSKKKPDEYEVGYGKPPKKSQFQKGVSGNPTGRPKKSCDLGTTLLREANSLVPITDNNGQRMRISKHDVAVKVLLNGAMKGKSSDQRLYFSLYPQAIEKGALAQMQEEANKEKWKDVKQLSLEELNWIVASDPETMKRLEEKERAKTSESTEMQEVEEITPPENLK
jgi:hypothetical protein